MEKFEQWWKGLVKELEEDIETTKSWIKSSLEEALRSYVSESNGCTDNLQVLYQMYSRADHLTCHM